MRKQKKGSRKPSLFSTIPVEVLLHIFAMFSSEVPDNGPHPGLPMSSWWELLGNLPGIEELELYSACVDTLSAAWKVNLAPAVLPALRKIRIEDSSLASPQQYSILGDPPARKIVQLPSHAEDDVAYLEPAEKELEDISKGLLKLLRGLGRKLPLNKR